MNSKKKLLTGLSIVSGWTMAKQAAGVASEAIETSGRIARMAREALIQKNLRHETFHEAIERLQITNTDLIVTGRSFAKRRNVWFFCFIVSFAFFASAPFVANPISHGMISAGAMALCLAKSLVWHFRFCQVRDQELYGFGPWFFSDIWVKRIYVTLVALFSIGLLIFSAVANAAEPGLHAFTPPVGDTSVNFLREVFGSIIDKLHSGADAQSGKPDSALGAMLGPFNTAVLFLGMIFVIYTTIKGTIDSAHDGQVLGKKMSEIWVPVRTVAGTAFLLPLGSGYSLIQIAILWLAIQSAGIADAVLSAGLDYIAETNMVSRPNLPDSRPLAANILKFEVCAAAMNKQYEESGWNTRISVPPQEKSWVVFNHGEVGIGDVVTTGVAGVAAGPVGALASAGYAAASASYRVTEFDWVANDSANKRCGSLTWRESDESSLGAGNTAISKRPIMLAQIQAVRNMIAELRPVAQQIVAARQMPAPGAIEAAASRYEDTLARAAKDAINNSSDAGRANFIQYAKDSGWIYLPTYYNQLIQLNDALQSTLNTLPASEGSTVEDKEVKDVLINYTDFMTVADEYLKRRDLAVKNAYNQQAADDVKIPTSWEDLKRLLSRPAQGAINQFTLQLAGSNLSHVGQIKAIGDTISHSAEVLLGIMATASGVANANAVKLSLGNFFDAGAALSSISGVFTSIIVMLFLFGAIAAYYIPLIPFIAGITAIIKWFIMVFEMVIAGPLMAAAHIHPDGDDVVGKASPGYMLILSMLMWPVLTVFGFFGSIWLAQPITGYINMAYMTAVAGAEHNSFSGLVAFVAYVVIYVIIMTGVVHSVFTLVNWLPTNALRVIGGAMGVHGIADDEPHKAESRLQAGMLNVKNQAFKPKMDVPGPGSGGKGTRGDHLPSPPKDI